MAGAHSCLITSVGRFFVVVVVVFLSLLCVDEWETSCDPAVSWIDVSACSAPFCTEADFEECVCALRNGVCVCIHADVCLLQEWSLILITGRDLVI